MLSIIFTGSMALLLSLSAMAIDLEDAWREEWPRTDFSRAMVDLDEITSGGPGKDGIPAIDNPRFVPVEGYREMAGHEPVIGLVIDSPDKSKQVARAYPLRILIWHEIVNDVVNGIPVAVTYCPLCNTSIVFDRRLDGKVLDFGTTGNVRHSDLVMYDRQTETWWQQYGGEAIVGELAGRQLRMIPPRLESLDNFRRRAQEGEILVPNVPEARRYGTNPYVGYDRSPLPFLFIGKLPKAVAPMMRVVAVADRAFTFPLVRQKGVVQHEGIRVSWQSGQSSALDNHRLDRGQDVGNVTVTRNGEDIPYVVTFAFAFFAFNPAGVLYNNDGPIRQEDTP